MADILTLATSANSDSNLNVFFTNKLFGPGIDKAKRLALIDLRECMATTGIMQTRSFYPPEVYVEYIDAVFRVVYLSLYRDYLETVGRNQTLSHGKLAAITGKVAIPNRIYELAIHTLSPVILKTEIFIPSIELVECRTYTNLSEDTYMFGTTLGVTDPLAMRYGITLRTGYLYLMKNLPGAMTYVTPFKSHEVYFVLRTILFKERTDNRNKDFNDEIDMDIEVGVIEDDSEIDTTMESLHGRTYIDRCENLLNDLFPDDAADFDFVSDEKWFVPYVYSRITEQISVVNAVTTYLPLVIYTADNIERNGITFTTLDVDIDVPSTYIPVFTNSLRLDFGAAIIQSLKALRIKEARLMPRFETGAEVFGVLRLMIIENWKEVSFPALDDIYTFTQPDWNLPTTSPLFPYQIRWIRQVRRETERAPTKPSRDTQKQENIHENKIT